MGQKTMKNIPSMWCLEPLQHYENDAILNGFGERALIVACLEGPGTVQVANSDGKTITLTENNPCALFNLGASGSLAWSLFSSPGLQSLQLYKRTR